MSLSTPLEPTSSSKLSTRSKPKKLNILKNFTSNKFVYFSVFFLIIFLVFINFVSPISVWSKILFFLIILSMFVSVSYVFSCKHCLNLSISFYLFSLLLLRFFHQLFLMNFIILTCLFICLFFIFDKPIVKN